MYIERNSLAGLYSFTAYIEYRLDSNLDLMLTENEVSKILSATKVIGFLREKISDTSIINTE